jgi:hypothetical protein
LTGLEVSIEYPPGQPVGWLEAVLDADRAPTTLALAATAGALPPATYTATVSVTSADAANSPQTLAVTFVVVPRAAAARPSPVEERIPIDR